MDILTLHRVVKQVDVFTDVFCTRAVNGGEKFIDGSVLFTIGIPEELGVQPGAQFRKLATSRRIYILLENALDIVFNEEPDIIPPGAQVGEGNEVVCEGSIVVPDPETVRDFGPFHQITGEGRVSRARAASQRMGETALDGAETDDHVGTGAHGLRGFAGPLVCKGFDAFAGKFFFHRLCDPIHQEQHRGHLRSLRISKRRALPASAEVIPVVLGDR